LIIERGDTAGIYIIIIALALWGPLYINARLMISDIIFDNDGISASVFGLIWKHISWDRVARIRTVELTNPTFKGATKTILIDAFPNNIYFLRRRGPIVFNDNILDYDSLVDLVNDAAARYKIAIYK